MTTFRLRVRHQGRLASLRGIDVERIEQAAIASRVPGSALGMALVHGQIIPVLRLGEAEGCLVVGRVHGEVIGVMGLQIVGLEPEDSALEPSTPVTEPVTELAAGVIAAAARDWLLASSPMNVDSDAAAAAEFELDIGSLIDMAKRRQQQSTEANS